MNPVQAKEEGHHDFMDRFFIDTEEEMEDDAGTEIDHAQGRDVLSDPPGRSVRDELDCSWHSFWTRRGLTISAQTSSVCSPSNVSPCASQRRLRSTAQGQDLLVARAALNCSVLQQHVDLAAASNDGDSTQTSSSTPRSSVASGRVSPIRGLRSENAITETSRGVQRSMAIIGIGLACFATAARVPKLTRMDIDVDWSREMGMCGSQGSTIGSASCARLGFSGVPTTTASASAARNRYETFLCDSSSVHCAAATLTSSSSLAYESPSQSNMRLRGGETPHFTPSASSCDLRRLSGLGTSSAKSCLCGDTAQGPTPDKKRAQNMARTVPKLSRTVDLH